MTLRKTTHRDKQRIHRMYLGTEEAESEFVDLTHAGKGLGPTRDGCRGRYIPHRTSVWARVGDQGEWRETPYTSVTRASDDLLNRSLVKADEAVELLVSGRRIAEREAAEVRYRERGWI